MLFYDVANLVTIIGLKDVKSVKFFVASAVATIKR